METSLNKRFTELHHIIQAHVYDENTQTEYQSTTNELEQIEKQKARGVIIQSK